MPFFQFKAMDRTGNVVTGTSAAKDATDLASILQGQGLFLVEGKEEKRPDGPSSAQRVPLDIRPDKVPLKEIAMFTTEFAIMVRTSLPILEALDSLERKQSSPAFRKILRGISADVRQGRPLSYAFGRYPNCFDEIYTSLLASGEASGNMAVMLDRIGSYLTFQREIQARIYSAILYPTVVVITAMGAVAFLVLFVLPTFAEIFSQFEVDLPLPTRVLLFLSAHFRAWWYVYGAGILALAAGVRRWLSSAANIRWLQALQLRLPVIGVLARNIVMTRVLRTLGTLSAGGVPILRAIELARASAGNAVFQDLLGKVYRSAATGKGLASALSDSLYFPETVKNMIGTAEHTSTLPEVLGKIADYYEQETDRSIKDSFTMLEPFIVLCLGLVVGGIALAVLWPVFELGNSIK